ncbi:MAG: SPOR domain-containing protein, partial [Novosphingobium sp.]|nr:SPOR domain-containing protein [Novosphingobium sp.]
GADYARPQYKAASPASMPTARQAAKVDRPALVAVAPTVSDWQVQLGAFSVAGNADRLWSELSGTAALSGKQKVLRPAGRLTKLLASGFASKAEADSACAALKRSGQSCLVTR